MLRDHVSFKVYKLVDDTTCRVLAADDVGDLLFMDEDASN
jgi:hypothetical protein